MRLCVGMSTKRQSILSRPLKACGKANEETAERNFEREQAILEGKRQRIAETTNFLRCSRFGEASYEEKVSAAENLRRVQVEHIEFRRKAVEAEKRMEANCNATLTSMESQQSSAEATRLAQRLAAEREAMELNRRLAEEKRAREKQEKAIDRQRDNVNLQLLSQERRSYR